MFLSRDSCVCVICFCKKCGALICNNVTTIAPNCSVESCGSRPIAADDLSFANFSVHAHHYEKKDLIGSQNTSYPFESSVNTAGTQDWWQPANKFGRDGRQRSDANAGGILADTQEMLSDKQNDDMKAAA